MPEFENIEAFESENKKRGKNRMIPIAPHSLRAEDYHPPKIAREQRVRVRVNQVKEVEVDPIDFRQMEKAYKKAARKDDRFGLKWLSSIFKVIRKFLSPKKKLKRKRPVGKNFKSKRSTDNKQSNKSGPRDKNNQNNPNANKRSRNGNRQRKNPNGRQSNQKPSQGTGADVNENRKNRNQNNRPPRNQQTPTQEQSSANNNGSEHGNKTERPAPDSQRPSGSKNRRNRNRRRSPRNNNQSNPDSSSKAENKDS